MKMILVLLAGLVCISKAVLDSMTAYKRHDECDLWAKEHGECVNNPRFMWTACIGSCILYAENTREKCDQWASEGECTNNPGFIHVNCPKSCSLAVAWSPWVRNKFAFEYMALDPADGVDRISVPNDIFEAAEIMRERLVKYFEGLYSILPAFSTDAPTEYLGMLGLAEAFLYCFRIHEVLYEKFNIPAQIEIHYKKINRILDTIRQGYAPDRLMMALPRWTTILNDSALLIYQAIREISQEEANVAAITSFHQIPEYYMGKVAIPPAYAGGQTVRLLNGRTMPLLGLGTWQMNDQTCYDAVFSALQSGHKLIDTAEAYGNEAEVGRALSDAIAQGIVTRQEVFLATKVSDDRNFGYDGVMQLVRSQLGKLQVKYIDLYMLHSPIRDKKLLEDTWRALEDLHDEGVINALGISNCNAYELEDLMALARVKPMVIQNKFDIYHVGKQLDEFGDRIVRFARDNGVVLMAYSPFSAFPFVMKPAEDPIVKYIAQQKSVEWGVPVTSQQILLKWTIQKGVVAIPRSASPEHQKDNMAVLNFPKLSEGDMRLLDAIQLLVSSPVNVPVTEGESLIEIEAVMPDEHEL